MAIAPVQETLHHHHTLILTPALARSEEEGNSKQPPQHTLTLTAATTTKEEENLKEVRSGGGKRMKGTNVRLTNPPTHPSTHLPTQRALNTLSIPIPTFPPPLFSSCSRTPSTSSPTPPNHPQTTQPSSYPLSPKIRQPRSVSLSSTMDIASISIPSCQLVGGVVLYDILIKPEKRLDSWTTHR